MSTKYPFTPDPVLTAIVVGYGNQAFIADEILPRTNPIGKRDFEYTVFDKADTRTIPSTLVGRRSRPNQVEYGSKRESASCNDHGLDDPIPQDDIDNAPTGHDPREQASENLMEVIALDREQRVAGIVQDSGNYDAENVLALAGTDKFSDYDPLQVLLDAISKPLITPDHACLSHPAWNKIRMHPKIVKAVHGNSGDAGVASRRQVADLLELEDIYVGSARYNVSRPGQVASYERVWGNHISLFNKSRSPSIRTASGFGYTVVQAARVAGTIHDPHIGMRGGEIVRVGESVKELICDPNAGFLLQNVI